MDKMDDICVKLYNIIVRLLYYMRHVQLAIAQNEDLS